MRLIKRARLLRLLKKISKEINNNKIDNTKVEKSTRLLRELQNGNITDDFIKDLDVLLYLAKKSQRVNSGERVEMASEELNYDNTYSKLNDLVDELDANNFIHHKIAGLGGILSFELTHKDNVNYFLHHKINEKISRLRFLKSTGIINKILNPFIERVDQIIIGVFLIFLGLLVERYLVPYLF